jgi:hypothetical protein
MGFSDPRSRRPRRSQPVVEGLEMRELMSTATQAPPVQALTATAASQNQLQATNDVVNSPVIQIFANLLYGPNSPTPMTPTPSEIKQQIFTAAWIGQYTVGPPRFSDRASTIHAYAVSGGSNQFLKGKFNMELFPPADPSAAPTPGNPYANQVTGIAGLFPQDLLQSGNALVLDLNATPSPGSDPLALPTNLTWTYDNNTSAGAYAAPALFTQGAGTLTIKWIPDAHPIPGTMGSGKMIVKFVGLINLSRVVNPIAKVIS